MPNYIPTTEIQLSIREKLNTLIRKGCYMIFLNGNPKFPRDQRSRKMMEVFKNHYPWVMDNKINPSENLEHFDLSRDKDIEIMLAKYIKFSEIPQFYVDGHLIGGLEIIEDLHATKLLENVLLADGKRVNPEKASKLKKKKTRIII